MIKRINLNRIEQPKKSIRTRLNKEVAAEFAERYEAGDDFPAIVVFDDGKRLVLADGRHRLTALLKIGRQAIDVDVRRGSERDAILFGIGANATHGQHRSRADKENAVKLILEDEKWAERSDRWVAEAAAVSDKFVVKIRRNADSLSGSSRKLGKDGRKQRRLTRANADVKAVQAKSQAAEAASNAASGKPAATGSDQEKGGYEPAEALKPFRKLDKAVGDSIRAWADIRDIVGQDGLEAIREKLWAAAAEVEKYRKVLARKVRQ